MSDDIRVTIAKLNHLDDIKRLLVLQLVSSGVRIEDVARCLGKRTVEIRKMIPEAWIARHPRSRKIA